MRVQIPAYTDRWMMGDRYGAVTKVSWSKVSVANQVRTSLLTGDRPANIREVAHVKLDKSGKTVRVILDDCEVVS